MYTLIRSARKTNALELTRQGDLIVRAPNRMPEREIRAFVASKEAWIRAHREKLWPPPPMRPTGWARPSSSVWPRLRARICLRGPGTGPA